VDDEDDTEDMTTTTQDITLADISSDATEGITIIDTTTETHDQNEEEEVLQKLIEDNEEREKELADSLEEVISNLSEFVTQITTTVITDDSEEGGKSEKVFDSDVVESTTQPFQDNLSDPGEHETVVNEEEETIADDFITRQALSQLQTANLSSSDMNILTALLELEILRGEQKDTRQEIQDKLLELEQLLNNNTDIQGDENNQILLLDSNADDQLPRRGKTVPLDNLESVNNIVETKVKTVNLFENIQKQLFSLLDQRHRFLQVVSQKFNSELEVIQQTVRFLQQLVNLKLDQGVMLLGRDNPILNILQSGSTSVFLMLTRFFQAVESVLSLRDEFLRTFSFDSNDIQEAHLLERIQKLKLDRILPNKIRFLMNVHTNSDKLGRLLEQMFDCVRQIVEAKIQVIESVGKFFENKIEFLSGFSGGGTRPEVIVEAVQTGNLFELLNFGPVTQTGVPGISDRELEKT